MRRICNRRLSASKYLARRESNNVKPACLLACLLAGGFVAVNLLLVR